MQHFLRFATHFIIILRQLGVLDAESEACDQILRSYVDMLVSLGKVARQRGASRPLCRALTDLQCGQNDIIAQYCELLPQAMQAHAYASFLRGMCSGNPRDLATPQAYHSSSP